jgi:hypothetical protein
MQSIELWDLVPDEHGVRDAMLLQAAPADETERLLEDLIVRRPELLGGGVTLVGRQVPTLGGPLDLLGIDQDGHVVVLELKRGVLTRDAVAQVLDYVSDIAEKGEESLARLIETNSGHNGIPAIEDFIDWYAQQYPDSDGLLAKPPRMILVGLGVDERARRITSFLMQRSVDIEVLTFHAFRLGDKLLMARLIEGDAAKTGPTIPKASKESNRQALHEAAEQLGVKALLEEVASFVATRLPGSYQWPGKTSYAFSLHEQTDEGNPTLRAYITIYLDLKHPKTLLFNVTPRAALAAGDALLTLIQTMGPQQTRSPRNQSIEHEFRITSAAWSANKAVFDAALRAVYAGWQKKVAADNAPSSDSPPTA